MQLSSTKGNTENDEELMGVVRGWLKEAVTWAEWIIEVPSWAFRITVNHIVPRLEEVGTIRTTGRVREGEMTRRNATIDCIGAPIRREDGTRVEVMRGGRKGKQP